MNIDIVSGSPFAQKVIRYIKSIPEGRIATYKQIAELSGKPQGSRGVSWILHSCSTAYKLPWHRVINSQGKISFDKTTYNYKEQKRRLQKEGIAFNREGRVDLLKFQWKKRPAKIKLKPGTPTMFR